MNWQIELLLTVASLVAIAGVVRMSLAIHATYWHNARCEEVNNLQPWNCTRFHEIQSRPRPLVVRINDWLEVHHV